MTVDLLEARQSILNIVPLLKEGKVIEAIASLSSGLEVVLKTDAPDNMKVAFVELLGKAMLVLSSSPAYKRLQIRPLNYERGQERKLYQQLKLLERKIGQAEEGGPRPPAASVPAAAPASEAAETAASDQASASSPPPPAAVAAGQDSASPGGKPVDLSQAKQNIMSIVPLLKEGKLIDAISSLSGGMETIIKADLPQDVTVSFTELLGRAILFLTSSPAYKEMKISPLAYEKGQEERLFTQLKGLESQIQTIQEEKRRLDKERQTTARKAELAAMFTSIRQRLQACQTGVRDERLGDASSALAEGLELWFRAKAPKEFAEAFQAQLEETVNALIGGLVQELPDLSLDYSPGQEKQLYNDVKALERQLVIHQRQKERQQQAEAAEALGTAKQKLMGIGILLKDGKLKEAASILADCVELAQNGKLMKAERERFGDMIDNAILRLSCSREFKRLNTTPIYYDRGQEKQLYLQLKALEREIDRFEKAGPAAAKAAEKKANSSGVPKPADPMAAKQLIINIGPMLKDGKLVDAIHSLMAGMEFFQDVRMTRNERDGFTELLDKSIQRLTIAPEYRKLNLTPIKYVRGQERQLAAQLGMLEEEIILVVKQHEQQEKAQTSEKLQKTLQKGFEMLDNKEIKRAGALLRNIATEKGVTLEILADVAKRFMDAQEPMYALDHIEAALKMSPEDVTMNALAGRAYQKTGKFDKAEAHYLKCLELGAASVDMFTSLGWLYLNARNADKAYEAAKQAMQIDSSNEDAQKLFKSAEKRIFG